MLKDAPAEELVAAVRVVAAGDALLAPGATRSACARLVISDATAKTHVARILQKLGLRDRVQVAIYAYEHGVVKPRG